MTKHGIVYLLCYNMVYIVWDKYIDNLVMDKYFDTFANLLLCTHCAVVLGAIFSKILLHKFCLFFVIISYPDEIVDLTRKFTLILCQC